MRALPSNCNFQCHPAMPGEPVVIPDNPVFSLAGIRVSPFRRLSRAKTNPRAASATNRRTYFRVNEKQMLAEPILTSDDERQPNRPAVARFHVEFDAGVAPRLPFDIRLISTNERIYSSTILIDYTLRISLVRYRCKRKRMPRTEHALRKCH